MKPEQPAARSKAAAPVAPSLSWTMQAVAGIGMSGVTVAQMIRSTWEARRPAELSACSAARVANWDMYSSSAAICRSRMPVREAIHSSDVSTIFSRSAFVRTRSGRADPVPLMTARFSPRVIEPPHPQVRTGRKRRAPIAGRRHPENFVVDAVIHAVLHEFLRHAHRVLDGTHGRPSVADDRRRPDPQERHAAVLGIVHFLAEVAEGRTRHDVSHLREE